MSKRGKKRVERVVEQVERVEPIGSTHRTRVTLYGLAFDFTTPSPDTHMGVTFLGNPQNTESLPLEIRFLPPLEKIYGTSSYISVTHLESMRRDTVIVVLPHTDDKQVSGDFFEFPTHAVSVKMDRLYLTLENVQMRGDVSVPIWQPLFNLGLGFFDKKRYQALPFLDPMRGGEEEVNLSQVPQSLPLYNYKPTGGITSSQVAKLLGYYPGGKQETFTGWKSVAVRFGRLAEAKVLLLYLKHHPERTFRQIGFTSLEHGRTELDGAQCDGIIDGEYPIEFKASRFNCNFEASYFAQCIWEMACGYPHIDLVRYCERQGKTPQGTWATVYECKEIRVYRHLPLEKQVIELAHAAKQVRNNDAEFTKLMETEPYKQIRAQLDALAVEANKTATDIPADPELIKTIDEYKKRVLEVQGADNLTQHPHMARIESRQARIFSALQEERKEELVKEVCDQIKDLCGFISH